MRVLFAAHDPGGANVIYSLIASAVSEQIEPTVWAAGPARHILPMAEPWEMPGDEHQVTKLLIAAKPDIVVTGTSMHSTFEQRCWLAAKTLGIPSIAVIDAWAHYQERFNYSQGVSVFPTNIFVIDQPCKEGIEAICPGETQVHIIGHPFLEQRMAEYKLTEKDCHPKRTFGDMQTIIFFSEPLQGDFGRENPYSEDQYDIANRLVVAAGKLRHQVLIKPHPREHIEDWLKWLELQKPGVGYVSITNDDAKRLLQKGGIVVGMATMVLVEAVLSGLKAISVQPGITYVPNPLIDRLTTVLTDSDHDALQTTLEAALELDETSQKAMNVDPRLFEGTCQRAWAIIMSCSPIAGQISV